MIYYYKTSYGTFIIKPHKIKTDHFSLYIDEKQLCTYKDAESAAEDVFTQSTGFPMWDNFDGRRYELPEDLSWWEQAEIFTEVSTDIYRG